MFITILEVLTDQSETKVLKLKFYLTLINTSVFQIFQKLERLIARIARKLNQTLLQLKKQVKIFFFRILGHQFLTEVEQAT